LKLKGPLVAIGDTHFPFHSKRWLRWVVQTIAQIQPEYVVQVGDLHDNLFLSKYARSLDIMTPRREREEGDKWARHMWAEVRGVVKKDVKCFQIRGNHDDRDIKRILEKLPEAETLVDLQARYTFPGVKTVTDSTEELFIGDVAVMHGYKSHGEHARFNQCPTIVGHLHTGGVNYWRNRRGVYWELNAGFGGDVNSPVFAYRSQKAIHRWTMGLGVVDEFGPRFMPFGR
jgi:predicted MPP superfamily phosphohydrolase